MATALQLRRGTTTQHSTFTGAAGEVTVDTTKKTAVVHDGSTAGGFPVAKENLSNVPAGSVTTTMLADSSVTTAKIAAGAVATVDLADAAVTTIKIADGNVTGAKLENSGVTAGTYGSSSAIPAITVDAKGRVTSATTNAFSSSYVGGRGQVFTSNGTFTIPTGVTAVKVTVVGGGGGGGGAANAQGSGGGGGGTAISFLTGLTPGNTLAVTVGSGGGGGSSSNGNGATGGTSSVASGTQTISTISATGGTGATGGYPGAGGFGGAGSGGSMNFEGGGPQGGSTTTGASMLSSLKTISTANGQTVSGPSYGGGGFGARAGISGCNWIPYAGGAGASGVVIFEW